jgi:hypothetical protein
MPLRGVLQLHGDALTVTGTAGAAHIFRPGGTSANHDVLVLGVNFGVTSWQLRIMWHARRNTLLRPD